MKQCGLGTFGKVFTCIDTKTRERVAVKVIRGIRRYAKSAKIEASIIQKVNNRDKDNTSLNVRLLSIFTEKSYFESDHVCLVFEQLDISIYDFMKQNQFRGFLYESIRDIARQMLHAVAFLHDMKLTHTDLKPENVLLVDASYVYIPLSLSLLVLERLSLFVSLLFLTHSPTFITLRTDTTQEMISQNLNNLTKR
jgi:serine/threonine protein kinase